MPKVVEVVHNWLHHLSVIRTYAGELAVGFSVQECNWNMNLAGFEDIGINTLCQDDAGTSVSQAEVKILLFKLRAASCITNKEHIVVFQTYLVQFFNQADEKRVLHVIYKHGNGIACLGKDFLDRLVWDIVIFLNYFLYFLSDLFRCHFWIIDNPGYSCSRDSRQFGNIPDSDVSAIFRTPFLVHTISPPGPERVKLAS